MTQISCLISDWHSHNRTGGNFVRKRHQSRQITKWKNHSQFRTRHSFKSSLWTEKIIPSVNIWNDVNDAKLKQVEWAAAFRNVFLLRALRPRMNSFDKFQRQFITKGSEMIGSLKWLGMHNRFHLGVLVDSSIEMITEIKVHSSIHIILKLSIQTNPIQITSIDALHYAMESIYLIILMSSKDASLMIS